MAQTVPIGLDGLSGLFVDAELAEELALEAQLPGAQVPLPVAATQSLHGQQKRLLAPL